MIKKDFDFFMELIKNSEENEGAVREYLIHLKNRDRGSGKTSTLRELGLDLMAQGYHVYILSSSIFSEYFAHGYLDPENCSSYYGLPNSKTVILVDECDYEKIKELVKYSIKRGAIVVGYSG